MLFENITKAVLTKFAIGNELIWHYQSDQLPHVLSLWDLLLQRAGKDDLRSGVLHVFCRKDGMDAVLPGGCGNRKILTGENMPVIGCSIHDQIPDPCARFLFQGPDCRQKYLGNVVMELL
jgi:hypothetical protein